MRMLYNPQLKGAYTSVPGVMGMILLLISAMMTSISIVREKELGTMEILLVSPMQPWLVVISKVIPYFIISLINVATILILSVFVLGLPIEGSLFLLIASTIIYIFCALSLGILISTVTETQQAAMLNFSAWLNASCCNVKRLCISDCKHANYSANTIQFSPCKMVHHNRKKYNDKGNWNRTRSGKNY